MNEERATLAFRCLFEHGEREKENALEAGFAIPGRVPLAEGVRAGAIAACAH